MRSSDLEEEEFELTPSLVQDGIETVIAQCVVAFLRTLLAQIGPLAFDVTHRGLNRLGPLKVAWPDQTCQGIDVEPQIRLGSYLVS